MADVIQSFTDDDLKAELERRERERAAGAKPRELELQTWGEVQKMCLDYIDEIDKNGWVDDDLEHYIFEGAMSATFGPDVWGWINKKLK
jgi:hypothetical protein